MNQGFFQEVFENSILCKQLFISKNASLLKQVSDVIVDQLKKKKRILLFGNGGSAADAQHLAAELVNRLVVSNRAAISAMALSTDTSILTSISNDISFSDIFSRQIEAHGAEGDIALGISTSGNSPNIINAFEAAKCLKMITVGLLGNDGGRCASLVTYPIIVETTSTQRIQETHITIGHAICEYVERVLFASSIKND
ncbi:SIS domain-containing protein [bacterium]|nr:SIS domain-containing protein [candidate division CSSED10-310 bacterium]